MEFQSRVEGVFQRVFSNSTLSINRSLSSFDIQGWDSLTNIRLILELEKEFSIKIKPGEVARLKDVGMLLDLINSKLE